MKEIENERDWLPKGLRREEKRDKRIPRRKAKGKNLSFS